MSISGRLEEEAGLEHEGHAVLGSLERLVVCVYSFLVGSGVRTVRSHAGVQGRGSWCKAHFGVVLAADVSHELSHAVSVVVGRFESVLSHEPARRKNHKIDSCSSIFNSRVPFHS